MNNKDRIKTTTNSQTIDIFSIVTLIIWISSIILSGTFVKFWFEYNNILYIVISGVMCSLPIMLIYLCICNFIVDIKTIYIQSTSNSKWKGKFKYVEVPLQIYIDINNISFLTEECKSINQNLEIDELIKDLKNYNYFYTYGRQFIKQIEGIETNYIIESSLLKIESEELIKILSKYEGKSFGEIDCSLSFERTGIILTNDVCNSNLTLFYNLSKNDDVLSNIEQIKEDYLITYFRNSDFDKCIDIRKKIDSIGNKYVLRYVDLPERIPFKSLNFNYLTFDRTNVVQHVYNKNTLKYVDKKIEDNKELTENEKISDMITEIDTMIENGWKFNSISVNKWIVGYKQEINNLLNVDLSEEQINEILNILIQLKNSMFNDTIKKQEFVNDATIQALKQMAAIDQII